MKSRGSSIPVVLFAFGANFIIAVMKFVVFLLTRSSAILAETVHSMADSMNQSLLLVGIRKGRREPDQLHPFGFSSELNFWSFIVAMLLFSAGSVYSIAQGIHKWMNPHPVRQIHYAFAILSVAIIAEGAAFLKARWLVQKESHGMSVYRYLRCTRKSELVVVFTQNLAAKLEFSDRLNARKRSNLISGFERDIREKYPQIRRIFIEPDILRPGTLRQLG
ncbi:MAG TPA: hypothetical protein ENN40_05015 [Candidatus Aminicenantes bacterium]|nr:hypothetical protein [Candidatus Aminicenantes bacterium]